MSRKRTGQLRASNGTFVAKYSEARAKRVLEAVEKGLPLRLAAAAGGVSRRTVHRWRQDRPKFAERFDLAESKAALEAIEQVRNAGRDDWRAAAWWLERRFPSELGQQHRPMAQLDDDTRGEALSDADLEAGIADRLDPDKPATRPDVTDTDLARDLVRRVLAGDARSDRAAWLLGVLFPQAFTTGAARRDGRAEIEERGRQQAKSEALAGALSGDMTLEDIDAAISLRISRPTGGR